MQSNYDEFCAYEWVHVCFCVFWLVNIYYIKRNLETGKKACEDFYFTCKGAPKVETWNTTISESGQKWQSN